MLWTKSIVNVRAMAETDTYHIEIQARSLYMEEESSAEEERYVFAYTITIRNKGKIPAQLLTRHWFITDSNNKVTEVQGEGVIGEQPLLAVDEEFEYSSAAVLETPVGCMHGSYKMKADDGHEFHATIEPFNLSIPNLLH